MRKMSDRPLKKAASLRSKLAKCATAAAAFALTFALGVPAQAMADTVTVTDAGGSNSAAIDIVDGVSIPGVTVNLFDYSTDVNDGSIFRLAAYGYTFFNADGIATNTLRQQLVKDSPNEDVPTATYNTPILKSILGADRTPDVEAPSDYSGTEKTASMDYLFNPSFTYADGAKKFHIATMANGGGLFQKVGNYYVYDSLQNAAYYNPSTKQFVLYDAVLRPNHVSFDPENSANPERVSNFLPFNEITSTSAVLTDDDDSKAIDTTTVGSETIHALKLSGQDTSKVDQWFGMTVDFEFYMPQGGRVNDEDMVFDFHGDDDVFVYINGVLVLDIGSTHGALDGRIDFSTGKVYDPTCGDVATTPMSVEAAKDEIAKDYGEVRDSIIFPYSADVELSGDSYADKIAKYGKMIQTTTYEIVGEGQSAQVQKTVTNYKTLRGIFENAKGTGFDPSHFNGNTFTNYTEHTLKFFYMERGGNISYCRLKFNMPILSGELNVAKHVDEGTLNGSNADYNFVLSECSESGEIIEAVNGVQYVIVKPDGSVQTKDENDAPLKVVDGKFTLKANEIASFLFDTSSSPGNMEWTKKHYCVEELSDDSGASKATKCLTIPIEADENHHNGIISLVPSVTVPFKLAVDETVDVEFENTLIEDLLIEKQVAGSSAPATSSWDFKVTLSGDILENIIPKDTAGNLASQFELACEVKKADGTPATNAQTKVIFDKIESSYVGYVTITAGQTVVIKGVPAGAGYDVQETATGYFSTSVRHERLTSTTTGTVANDDHFIKAGWNSKVTFTNTFAADGATSITGSKTLMVGQSEVELSDYPFDFEFTIAPHENTPAAPMPASDTVKVNKETGEFAFGEISYSYEDIGKTYKYIIREVNGGNAYVSYDDSYYVATVLVGYDAQAHEVTTSAGYVKHNADGSEVPGVASSKAAFTNTYTPPVVPPTPGVIDFQLGASKQLVGADLEAGAFSFALSAIGDAPMPAGTSGSAVATNDASGAVSFPAITVSAEDAKALGDGAVSQVVYEYVITEQAGTDENIEYDAQPVTVKVTITKTASNTLKANVAYSKAGIAGNNVFVNTYTEPEPEPEPEEPLPDTGDDPKDPKPERPDGPLAPTGDSAPIALILTAMALAVAAFAFALRMRRTNP